MQKYAVKKLISPLELEILLSYVMKKTRECIVSRPETKLTLPQVKKLHLLINKRLKGEPIAYLVKKKEFYGLDFYVDKNVLIPRPETELLVSETIGTIQNTKCKIQDIIIVDVGTGSGNIIVSIAKKIPKDSREKIDFFGMDISKKALNVAQKNSRSHETDRRIKLVQSDLLAYFLKHKPAKGHLIIVANLPYISSALYKKYHSGLKYEPRMALVSGNNGLQHYSRLLGQIRKIMRAMRHELCVTCLLEISPEQRNPLLASTKKILTNSKVGFIKDLAGKWRAAEIRIYSSGRNFSG